ncbi:MAG: c-type cytochrome [Proteobacteria bacterium]|nr:c-type cytochrome [Pseudomonadota bacterium]
MNATLLLHRSLRIAAAFGLSALLALDARAAGDADRGQALYQSRCAACHSIDYNGVGPAHKGVFGREAGQATGFDYSPALKASHLIWTEANLDRWLTDPEKLVPGQRMNFSVPDAKDRADLIAYLQKAATPK